MKAVVRVSVVILCAAALSQAATLTRYPYLQNVRGDRATILWATAESGSGTVQYSTDQSYSKSVTATVRQFLPSETGERIAFYLYKADLTGLAPGTQYFYRVLVDGQNLAPDPGLHFQTAAPGPFTFLAFGDSGVGGAVQAAVRDRMLQEKPALILHTGDIAYANGTFTEFESYYFAYYLNLMKLVPFFPTPGNHDCYTANCAPYLAVHSVPAETVPSAEAGRYYSFDWGNVHFISLDSAYSLANAVNGTSAMLDWLENDLQKTQQFWRIAYFHHAPYAEGEHRQDPLVILARNRISPILERHGIQLVLNGHEHNYSRSVPIQNGAALSPGTGTVYVTTGGGGGDLYNQIPDPLLVVEKKINHYVRADVQGSRITLRAIDLNGQEIDNFTLAPAAQISAAATVNSASFTTSLAPGGLVSIFGQNLAMETNQAAGLPLPTDLSGSSVTLNGQRLPLLYVSPSQINAQLPFDAGRQGTLRVTSPNGFSEASITISDTAPAIFLTNGGTLGAVVHLDGTPVSATSPAGAAEAISVYMTGLGQVNGTIAAGMAAPSSPPVTVQATTQVQFDSVSVTPSFAGLAPGFTGLYQVNVSVPSELPSGTYSLRVLAGGNSSNAVTVVVRSPGR